ncbi:MAG: hypothetical protein CMH54_03085 [Myxococcales bacterium]|nr:hypothetical protein [Myxococcales bacterium]
MTSQEYLYEVWTDSDKTLALYYGAVTSDLMPFPSRITRLLDAEGNLILEYNTVSVDGHPQAVLDDCTKIFGP